jgi:5-deoxy-glucuronate isomerase
VSKLHVRLGRATDGRDPLVITPKSAGWTYAGLEVIQLGPGEAREIAIEGVELAVVPLRGGARVAADGHVIDLAGRPSVFAAVTDLAYVPLDSALTVSSAEGAELALATARATRRFEAAYIPVSDVPVEVRGAGRATRQVNDLLAPGSFTAADKLCVVEVLTPDGNWSSYPPHKHDTASEHEVVNEEIYYFRVAGRDGVTPDREGFGVHRTYTPDGELDETVTVRDGDAFLVPRGFHGPSIAAPGHHLYYLNVLAGPGAERSMAFCDDPAHHWIRESWADQPVDPRCPLTR